MTEEKKSTKWPSLAEVSKMATKLFGDIKQSCGEIYQSYKDQHPDTERPAATKSRPTEKPTENNNDKSDPKK